MEWQLADETKAQYDKLFNNAREVESSIGSSQYRLYRLCKMREDLDIHIKKWWDETIEELSIPKDKDYMITQDGMIKEVPKQKPSLVPGAPESPKVVEDVIEEVKPKSNVGTNAADLK